MRERHRTSIASARQGRTSAAGTQGSGPLGTPSFAAP